ncbi:hypothetical protein NBRC10513v2_000822 [Rhodotorula toruloides]|uniref:Uncharacterized protein n=1 Tax=Rhodotorula toruloides TaxID=5286 RepID=A0A0K3CI21_RHOTO
MGLFRSNNRAANENLPPSAPPASHTTVTTATSTPHGGGPGLFGKRKSVSRTTSPEVQPANGNRQGGLLGKKRGSGSSSDSDGVLSGHTFSKHDTLAGARTKLQAAQQAESAADTALLRARQAVKEARAEIIALEGSRGRSEGCEGEAEDGASRLLLVNNVKLTATALLAKSFRREGDKLGRHS